MIVRRETPELHFFAILDFFRVTITPFDRHVTVGVGVHKYIEGTIAVKHRQERHTSGDLAEYGLDFFLDLLFRLLG